jgi:hypothetical protein
LSSAHIALCNSTVDAEAVYDMSYLPLLLLPQ